MPRAEVNSGHSVYTSSMLVALCTLLTLTACGTAPTTAARPASFHQVVEGKYRISEQPRMVDCVFDGFLGSQNMAVSTHVRQTKRANGYRIDVIAGPFQYVVADVRDDATFTVVRSDAAALVSLSKEEESSRACLRLFEAR